MTSLGDPKVTIIDDDQESHIIHSIDRIDDGISDAMYHYICDPTVDLNFVQNQLADDADFTGARSGS